MKGSFRSVIFDTLYFWAFVTWVVYDSVSAGNIAKFIGWLTVTVTILAMSNQGTRDKLRKTKLSESRWARMVFKGVLCTLVFAWMGETLLAVAWAISFLASWIIRNKGVAK